MLVGWNTTESLFRWPAIGSSVVGACWWASPVSVRGFVPINWWFGLFFFILFEGRRRIGVWGNCFIVERRSLSKCFSTDCLPSRTMRCYRKMTTWKRKYLILFQCSSFLLRLNKWVPGVILGIYSMYTYRDVPSVSISACNQYLATR